MKNFIQDIDYMAQKAFEEKNILPDAFYQQSFSNWLESQHAESRDDRELSPEEFSKRVKEGKI